MSPLKQLARKFSISAPQLAVRPHIPWYLRWSLTLPFILLAGALIWWAYDSGLELAGFHRSEAETELARLREEVATLNQENTKLLNQVASFERQLQIEQAQKTETEKLVAVLNDENARLKEDLSFFQNLPLSRAGNADLTVHRLKLEADALPGEYHCHLLLVQHVSQRVKEFQGHLQLLINGTQEGKRITLSLPAESGPESAAFALNFKYYQRIDLPLNLPPELHIDSLQVRVFEKGVAEPKAKKTITYP